MPTFTGTSGKDVLGGTQADVTARDAGNDLGDVFLNESSGQQTALDADLVRLGGNPFALGLFDLRQAGNDVQLVLIPSVSGDVSEEVLLTFRNTQVAAFAGENLSGFDPQATPLVPRYIYENTTISTGAALSIANATPDGLTLTGANSHFVYRAAGDVAFLNTGDIAAFGLVEAIGVRWNQYGGGSFVNSGTIVVRNSPD